MSGLSCKDLVESYIKWLREGIRTEIVGEYCQITTPFVDRNNDCMQIYVKQTENGYILTDDSATIRDLEMSGLEFNSERRKIELNTILNGFGIHLTQAELQVEARPDNFPKKKHCLLQAMLAINDLFVLAPAKVESFFREDVEIFLSLHDVRFTKNVDFIGRSGYNQHFDFVIPASRQKPERLLRAITNPRKDTISSLLFAWDDVRTVREQKSQVIAVVNDFEKPIASDTKGALDTYGVTTMPWSQRDQFVKDLAA